MYSNILETIIVYTLCENSFDDSMILQFSLLSSHPTINFEIRSSIYRRCIYRIASRFLNCLLNGRATPSRVIIPNRLYRSSVFFGRELIVCSLSCAPGWIVVTAPHAHIFHRPPLTDRRAYWTGDGDGSAHQRIWNCLNYNMLPMELVLRLVEGDTDQWRRCNHIDSSSPRFATPTTTTCRSKCAIAFTGAPGEINSRVVIDWNGERLIYGRSSLSSSALLSRAIPNQTNPLIRNFHVAS